MTKIVVLDGFAMFNTDIPREFLNEYGEVKFYERTSDAEISERIADADIVLTNKCYISKKVIDSCPNLKYISVLATGYNVVDYVYARNKGIPVSNVPNYSSDSVAQHTFALLLELCALTGKHDLSVKNGEWGARLDFCYWLSSITELSGKVFGIIGYGNIGKSVKKIAEAFGMKVLINTRTPFDGSVSLEEVLAKSDVVSLHCPLTEDNIKLINEDTLSLMKPTAFLINTARGGLIDEKALSDALKNNRLAGAGLDVLSEEPPKNNNPLINIPNCIITPHIAWASIDARMRLYKETLRNIKCFLEGKPRNVIN